MTNCSRHSKVATLSGLMPEQRLDSALTQRGLARSRTHAARLIAEGLVTVNGKPAVKASMQIVDSQLIEVAATDHYVSRAAHKLVAALDAFDLRVEGRLALDVGASTGGFTQVLLERGVRQVIALDVGHDQLDPTIRRDPRVVTVEGFNARSMTAVSLAAASGLAQSPTIVVADVSFISLGMILPALVETIGTGADFVVLIKPQFEVGRTGIREGIVRDAGLRTDAVTNVLWTAWDLGLPTAGVIPSPIAGNSGNREYVAWLSTAVGSNPTEWLQQVYAMA
jgi:23S rRNA (cytidine1920-2'-O)/16S rRNA (cytidine1409-2'-O)-methyltransferase